ncbi:universal stress protein [Mesorhizobium sp. A623]
MNLQAFVPLVTYPEANVDVLGAHVAFVAAEIGAAIHAAAINADIPDTSNTLSRLLINTPKLIREAQTASRHRGEHLLTVLKEKAETAGVQLTTAALSAPLALLGEAAALHARYYDLSLVGWEAGNQTSRTTAEAVIFGSGRPTLLLPELWDITSFDHVAIAWDGSRVAARAIADARFALNRAERISILTVVDEKPLKENSPGEKLASRLRESGLNAEAIEIKAQSCPIAATLQQTAIEKEAQLLVMGGYGHSRLRDFVLGGATEGILSNLLIPALISH